MDGAKRDVLVLGAGPAALALAAACAESGLTVGLVSPSPRSTWQRSFGSWACGLSELALDSAVSSRSSAPVVYTRSREATRLDATYWRFDTARLQALLLSRCERAAVEFFDGHVTACSHTTTHSSAQLADGSELCGRIVADATGSQSHFSLRSRSAPRAFQSAYGVWLDGPSPFADGEMTLMDFRPCHPNPGPLTFLYAMPDGPLTFVQETCLASESPISMEYLAARLEERLAALGLNQRARSGSEQCVIPMGVGLPLRDQPILPFGASAGYVHPATGYQLSRALRAAPRVAESLAKELPRGRGRALDLASRAVWSDAARNEFALYDAGLGILLGLDAAQTRSFMAAFFALPTPLWLGFMEGTSSTSQIAAAMWRVFAAAPARLRFELLRGSAISGARALNLAAS